MNKYPYIGKDSYNQIYLMLSNSDALTMDSAAFTHTPIEEGGYKNITNEYLANTYGEVQSPEHAEFIIELAKLHGFELISNGTSNKNFFHIGGKSFAMLINEPTFKGGCKQITIPLPPKQIQTATPEEEFEMTQIMKNAGDNLVLGCEDSKCDEWPRVGDEVLVCSSARRLAEIKGKAIKVIGKCNHSDGDTILTVEHSSLGVFAVTEGSWIKKPKTPEEELRDEIVNLINYAELFSDEVVADALMSKYNITKKPQ